MSEVEARISRLAKNIKTARHANGLSQRDLVLLLNEQLGESPTNRAAVARLELGTREPRLSELVALAKVFYVELESLTWEPSDFEEMLRSRSAISRFDRASTDLLNAASQREVARKELLKEIQEHGDAWPAGMRGFLRRDASIRSDEVVETYLNKHENR